MTDQHSFHVLLPQHAVALHRRALRLTSNEHRAEDLVQATFLKAWTKRDSYHPETNLRAWLFTILRNTFFSDLRKLRREVEDVNGTRARALLEEPRQDHALALRELIAAITLLPHAQRWPLVLMGAYGFSQLEAAEACGCTVGTIKSRVSRSRATLTHIMAHDEVAPRPRMPHVKMMARPSGELRTEKLLTGPYAGSHGSDHSQSAFPGSRWQHVGTRHNTRALGRIPSAEPSVTAISVTGPTGAIRNHH